MDEEEESDDEDGIDFEKWPDASDKNGESSSVAMSEEEDDTNYDKDDISMIDSMFKSTGSGQTMSFKVPTRSFCQWK